MCVLLRRIASKCIALMCAAYTPWFVFSRMGIGIYFVSKEVGGSEVEEMAHKIESRRANRTLVTMDVRRRLLHECRTVALAKGYPKSRILLSDLHELREKIQEELNERKMSSMYSFFKLFGVRDNTETLLQVLDKGVEVVQNYQLANPDGDDYFFYQDFNFYHTKVESRWPWFRPGIHRSFAIIFAYYFFAPVWFCVISHDSQICDTSNGRPYSGWVSALYFASTTLSTVGYGDLSVTKEDNWRVFVGIVYMIFSNVTLIFAFSAAVDSTFSPFQRYQDRLVGWILGPPSNNELLWRKMRRLKTAMAFELIMQFILLNAIGVFVSRIVILVSTSNSPDENWDWMTSVYWAVQTTTTIGYGDLSMPFHLRFFQIFYLILSTYYVGNAIGGLAGLPAQMEEIRRKTAWERREVSKGMIDEMQGYRHDDKIDQYEFAIASLLTLGKVTADDLGPIMDKFRQLSDDNGFIVVAEAREDPRASIPPQDNGEKKKGGGLLRPKHYDLSTRELRAVVDLAD